MAIEILMIIKRVIDKIVGEMSILRWLIRLNYWQAARHDVLSVLMM